MTSRRLLLIFVAVALLGSAFFIGTRFNRSTQQEPAKEGEAKSDLPPNTYVMTADAQRNIQLTVAPVEQEKIVRTIHVTGAVTPDSARVAHVFPLSQGVVRDIFVQLGSAVRTGQSLLRYDNVQLGVVTGEYSSLRGSLEKAIAQQNVSSKSLARAASLLEVEAISKREYELRQAEKEQADAAVASARAELATSEEKLHRFGLSMSQINASSTASAHRTSSLNDLRAPIGGIVSNYAVATGELIGPEKEAFTVVDPSVVWVLADVYEKDLGSIPQQGVCRVTLAAYPKEIFIGRVTYLSESLDPQSRSAKLRCVLPNPGNRIRLDMFAELELPTNQQQAALTIPNGAIQEIDNEPVVFVQRGPEQFERRNVKLGAKGDQRTEITAGLKPEERVVTNGTLQLKFQALRGTLGDTD